MNCAVCSLGRLRPGSATVTLARGRMTLVVRGVPAQVCENCGEEFVDEDIARGLLAAAEDALRAGVQVEVREYAA